MGKLAVSWRTRFSNRRDALTGYRSAAHRLPSSSLAIEFESLSISQKCEPSQARPSGEKIGLWYCPTRLPVEGSDPTILLSKDDIRENHRFAPSLEMLDGDGIVMRTVGYSLRSEPFRGS